VCPQNVLGAGLVQLPQGLSLGDCWILLFMFYCMLFNFIPLVSYCLVNYGIVVHGQLVAMEKEAKVKHESTTRGVSIDGVEVEFDPPFTMTRIARMRHLDEFCRIFFPILFILGLVGVLVPVFFAGPLATKDFPQ